METCKKKTFFLLLIFIYLSLSYFFKIEAKDLSEKVSIIDFVMLKYDIYFTKNKINILKTGGMTVKYNLISHKIKLNDKKEIDIKLRAVMEKKRYLSVKKYNPKITDCNIVRNKILLNKRGYTMFRLKKNFKVSEELLRNELLNHVMDITSLNEEEKNLLVDNTNIAIDLIHPISSNNISCSGKLVQLELN